MAIGGGGFQMPPDNGRLDAFLLALARERSGRERPRICFVPTAGADDDWGVARFYGAFARSADASHLGLFWRTIEDVDAFLLDQDLVFIGGGARTHSLSMAYTTKQVRFIDTVHMFDRDRPPSVRL